MKPVFAIARHTFQEAVRNRLFLLTLVGLLCLLGITAFVGDLAITESAQIQALLIGGGMRWFTVCTVSLFVITSTVREFNEKGFELVLSLPIPRRSYFFGKFLGFLGLAVVIACATSVLLLIYCQPGPVLFWLISLCAELAIMIALSLLLLFTFSNVTVAFVLALAFYLLARSMDTILLISRSPILESRAFSQEFMNWLVNALAYVLPGLDHFTRSEWLVYGVSWTDLYPVLVQTAIYVTLLVAAGLYDLYRKDL